MSVLAIKLKKIAFMEIYSNFFLVIFENEIICLKKVNKTNKDHAKKKYSEKMSGFKRL